MIFASIFKTKLSVQPSYRAPCDVGGFDWDGLRGGGSNGMCAVLIGEFEAPQTIFAGIFGLSTLLLGNQLTPDLLNSEVSIHLVSTMAGALTESIISGVVGQNFKISEGTREIARAVARETAGLVADGIVTDIALAHADLSGVRLARVATKVSLLVWKAGAYLYHNNTLQNQLAVCLEEYCEAGYLEKTTTPGDDNATIWQTTPVFRDAKMVLDIYPDIKQYLNDKAFTEAEMRKIGIYSDVSLYADSKKVSDLEHRLSACCARAGVKDITKTDAEKRIANVSFVQMGAIALQNAFIAEGERRERGNEPAVVPVLGRILCIAAICGLKEITIAEISGSHLASHLDRANGVIATILGKAPIFETVARARIAKLRKQRASHIFNGLLFGGSTESAGELFEHISADERVLVGRVKDVGKSEFLEEYALPRCELSGPVEKYHEIGKPIYMMAGWANLIKHREPIEKQHGAITQMAHLHSPTKACDIHGNSYMSAGKMSKIVFTVKELADGPLMAKPQKFGRFNYYSKADFKNGSILVDAMGEEKLFGGIVGPAVCSCQGGLAEANAKGQLIKTWKLGKGLKITSRDFVGNSISHTNDMSTKKISILWRPGDWAMGCFFMQTLPQSSYLQGRGQCLHCAVEGAALAGCPEVIACGGGKVSIEAFEHERQKAVMEGQRPISTLAKVVPGSPTSIVSSPVADILTPPPPYSSLQGSPRPARVDYFASSDANGDKIVPADAVMSITDQVVPGTGIIPINEKIARDRIFPSNDITSTSGSTVPTNKSMSSGDQIVPTKITSIGDKIAPTNKDEVVATNDLITFGDQGTTNDLISLGGQGATDDLISFSDQGATNDLISFSDQGATNDLMSLGDQGTTNDLKSLGDRGATNDIIPIGDKITPTKQVRSENETVATNEIMSIGNQVATNNIIPIGDKTATDDMTSISSQVITNDLMSIGNQVTTDNIVLIGDQVAPNDIIPINDKITPTKQVRSEDKPVATNDLISNDDQVAIDDITSISDKVAPDDMTPIGDKVAKEDTTPIGDKVAKEDTTPIGDKVAKEDTTPVGDKVATDDITPISDKVATDNVTPISDKVATDNVTSINAIDDITSVSDIASIASQRVPSIDIKSFAAKIGNNITRKPSGSTPKPEEETVTALYDFQVQVEGHLTFKRGDVIRIVKKPEDENEWWTGELNGKQGIFPGNHVGLSSAQNPTAETITGKAVATSKRLGSTAAAASKKLGSTAAATSKRLGSTAAATSKKLGSTAATTSKKLGSTAATTSKKLGTTAAATSKRLGSTATATPKKPESTASATPKPESTATATPKKPESTAVATPKKPELAAAAIPEKPGSTAAATPKKPESTAAATSKKPESTAAAASKKLGSTAATTSKKLGSTAATTSKKLGSTAAATSKKLGSTTSKKLGSTARWLKKGCTDISRIAGRSDAQGLENAGIGSSEDVTPEDTTADDATADNVAADDATVDDATVDDTTADGATVDDATADDATVDDATVDDATADDAIADDATVDDTTADDATADDVTVDDATVDDATADGATMDDVSADDAITDDATADDVIADDAASEDAIAGTSEDFTEEDVIVEVY